MSIQSPEGLEHFLSLQEDEIGKIRDQAASIPKKIARLPLLVHDEDLHESYCESIAFRMIHRIYTGIESVLEESARQLDGFVPDGQDSHAKLINQMSKALGERKAILAAGIIARSYGDNAKVWLFGSRANDAKRFAIDMIA